MKLFVLIKKRRYLYLHSVFSNFCVCSPPNLLCLTLRYQKTGYSPKLKRWLILRLGAKALKGIKKNRSYKLLDQDLALKSLPPKVRKPINDYLELSLHGPARS